MTKKVYYYLAIRSQRMHIPPGRSFRSIMHTGQSTGKLCSSIFAQTCLRVQSLHIAWRQPRSTTLLSIGCPSRHITHKKLCDVEAAAVSFSKECCNSGIRASPWWRSGLTDGIDIFEINERAEESRCVALVHPLDAEDSMRIKRTSSRVK